MEKTLQPMQDPNLFSLNERLQLHNLTNPPAGREIILLPSLIIGLNLHKARNRAALLVCLLLGSIYRCSH